MTTTVTGFGPLLKEWRQARRMSQQRLAQDSEVSARHISFVENGKSAPSRQMVLILASALDLPLRERNTLLSAAGFAPVYRQTELNAPEMKHVNHTLDLILKHQEPYPTVVLNHRWDLVKMNAAASRIFAAFLDADANPIVLTNVVHAMFHPTGLRRYILNWDEVASYVLDQISREVMIQPESGDHRSLLKTLHSYPGLPSRSRRLDVLSTPKVCITMNMQKNDIRANFMTTITTLGTPLDVTAQELRIESFFPADDATEEWLRQAAN